MQPLESKNTYLARPNYITHGDLHAETTVTADGFAKSAASAANIVTAQAPSHAASIVVSIFKQRNVAFFVTADAHIVIFRGDNLDGTLLHAAETAQF